MATMEVLAVQRFVRRTPRKARLVADSVTGMKVTDALAYLEFSPKHAARDVAKAIKSAAANAEHNFNLNREDLMVKQLLIDEGPTYRRRRPVSRSMAHWFANPKDYTKMLHEDLQMRGAILARLRNAGIAKIETERSSNAQLTVTIHTAKPGIVIGKGGSSVDQLREDLEKRFGNRVRISIQEIKQPELNAQLVAENIASQIERRISYKRAMKQAILRTMRAGAKGVRVYCGGRLRGAEMARREWDREGRVPLHTLRADIDFGRATAKTTFGAIGVKVWIFKDQISPAQRRLPPAAEEAPPIAEIIAPQPELVETAPEPVAEVAVPT